MGILVSVKTVVWRWIHFIGTETEGQQLTVTNLLCHTTTVTVFALVYSKH